MRSTESPGLVESGSLPPGIDSRGGVADTVAEDADDIGPLVRMVSGILKSAMVSDGSDFVDFSVSAVLVPGSNTVGVGITLLPK